MNGIAALIEALVYKIWMIRITISFKKDLKRIYNWSENDLQGHELDNEDLKKISRRSQGVRKISRRLQVDLKKDLTNLKKIEKTEGKKDLMKITKRKLKIFKIMLLNPDEMFESNVQMISTCINIRNNCTLHCALLKKEGGGEHMPSMAVFTSLVFSYLFCVVLKKRQLNCRLSCSRWQPF